MGSNTPLLVEWVVNTFFAFLIFVSVWYVVIWKSQKELSRLIGECKGYIPKENED